MTQPTTSPLEQVQDTIRILSDTDFRTLRLWVADDEVKRREAAPQIEAARAADTQKLWEARPDLKPKFETDPHEVTVTPTTKDGTITKAALLKAYPPFVQPTGAHDALPTGAIVTDEGRIWRTDLPTLNVWKPGTMNAMWVDITDMLLDELNQPVGEGEGDQAAPGEGEVTENDATMPDPEWKPDVAVRAGDQLVFKGDTYEVLQPHTTASHWPPDAVPALYKKL